MRCSGLLILGLLLNVAHCSETLDQSEEALIEISPNTTAALGADVQLSCRYLGERELLRAAWYRRGSKSRGLTRIQKRGSVSELDSHNNLTISMNVDSVELEGEYICQLETDEQMSVSTFVTVVARPDIEVVVSAETVNGTHYQSVRCAALGGRPAPHIRWLLGGLPVSRQRFAVDATESVHPNGTSTLSSVLRFATHLQDEDSATCEVQHPTLPSPELTTVRVETFARPNVSIEAEMVQRGGSDFWVVSCVSSGGKPDTDISLALNADEEPQRENHTDSGWQKTSVYLLAAAYEGREVTCVFHHPKLPHGESRDLTLPTFYFSEVLVLGITSNGSLELQEGQREAVISLQAAGNVPRYNVTCKKDGGPLPEDIQLADSSLTVGGPVERHHAGVYDCVVSYHRVKAALQFNVTVKVRLLRPVPPTIRLDLRTEPRHKVMECSAADAVPAANVSWLLPAGVTGVSWFNSTSRNGSHSVRGSVLLPACLPRELTAECVINHPAFEKPENRSVTLPLCARPNMTIHSSTEWKGHERFTKVDCSADSVAANITWRVGDTVMSDVTETDVQADASVSARSSVHFLSSLYAGQNLTCLVEHPSLKAPETRTIHIPLHPAPLLRVFVMRQHDSHLWLAVCDCRGEDVGTDLTWILPDGAKGQTSLQSERDGHVTKVRLTYAFPLARHEGHNLTCVYRFERGMTEKRSVRVPRYHIAAVRVLNRTAPLRSRYGGKPLAHTLALEERRRDQRILLQVEGDAPHYELSCKRSDGTFVHMEGLAMVFQSELSKRDEGLYTCQASFYHHMAAVSIQVEVTSEDEHTALAAMICVSSGLAVLFIFIVTLWVCCKMSSRTKYKKQESLSALTTLMQEPGSPEVKKPAATEADGNNEYAHLVSYSIVIDVKSEV